MKSWQLSDGLTKTVPPAEPEFPVLPLPPTQLLGVIAAAAPEALSSTPDAASERLAAAHVAITVTRRAFEMMFIPRDFPSAGFGFLLAATYRMWVRPLSHDGAGGLTLVGVVVGLFRSRGRMFRYLRG